MTAQTRGTAWQAWAALAEEPESMPVTDWPERLAWIGALLLALVAVYLVMWRGWRRRGARQDDVPALPPAPDDVGPVLTGPVDGVYVSTTRHSDWLDRVVRHGLGSRSRARATVAAAGVLLHRQGAPDVFVPAGALCGSRLTSGMAGKFVEEDGLVVVTWEHGGALLDTAFRAREVARNGDLRNAVSGLVGGESA